MAFLIILAFVSFNIIFYSANNLQYFLSLSIRGILIVTYFNNIVHMFNNLPITHILFSIFSLIISN